jgi:hypothetical protein
LAITGVITNDHFAPSTVQCVHFGGPGRAGWVCAFIAGVALGSVVAVLQSAVKQLRWKDPTQVFFPAGSQHDAYVELRKIVQLATREILIVDNYVDQTLWQLLTNIAPSVTIRILTGSMKGDFKPEAGKFAVQHGNRVEVRQTS